MSTVKLKSAPAKIGQILRVFREKTGRNQREIASLAGISISMLSQIERGVVSPSIETLMEVCSVLGLDTAELFSRLSRRTPVRINHPGQRLTSKVAGALYEQLVASPDASHPAEMILLEVKPDKQVGLKGKGHEGVEMGYVLEGSAILAIDDQKHELSQGDSFSFASYLPHKLINNSNKTFRAVWTMLPPHKDYLDTE